MVLTLFVFLMHGSKQNAGSLLTTVSDTVIDVLTHGTLTFALHGRYLNHFLIGGNSSAANQIVWNKWLLELPWKAKPRVPCERASVTMLETGVKSDPAICMGSSVEKTNSVKVISVGGQVKLPWLDRHTFPFTEQFTEQRVSLSRPQGTLVIKWRISKRQV